MAVVTAKVNFVLLNRRADMFFMGNHVAAPFGSVSAKDLPAALESHGADSVLVTYHTVSDRKARESDQKKYTKRVEALDPHYTRGPWSQQAIDGFVFPDKMVCTLTRKKV